SPDQNTVVIGVSEPRVLFLGGSPTASLFLYDVIMCVACGGRVNFVDDELVAWTLKPLQDINRYVLFGGLVRYLSGFHRFQEGATRILADEIQSLYSDSSANAEHSNADHMMRPNSAFSSA